MIAASVKHKRSRLGHAAEVTLIRFAVISTASALIHLFLSVTDVSRDLYSIKQLIGTFIVLTIFWGFSHMWTFFGDGVVSGIFQSLFSWITINLVYISYYILLADAKISTAIGASLYVSRFFLFSIFMAVFMFTAVKGIKKIGRE